MLIKEKSSMKSLIVSKAVHRPEEIAQEACRFSGMAAALRLGGIKAHHAWVETLDDLQSLIDQHHPDIVFSAAYSVRNKQNQPQLIHAFLEEHHIAYIGSTASALALVLSKTELKDLWKANEILTPDYFVVRKLPDGRICGLETAAGARDFPYILKPSKEGNSRGITQRSIISDSHILVESLLAMLTRYDEILVEKYLGTDPHLREFTVALIGNKSRRLILPCEIVLQPDNGYRVITTADKDGHRTQTYAVSNQALYNRLVALAEKAFDIAGIRDYARFDVLYSEEHLYAIEINGQPMVPDRWFEACARGGGLEVEQYLNAIYLAGITRNRQHEFHLLQAPGKMAKAIPGDIYRHLNHVP
jgi:D-alanine-D-alanine ligase